MGRRPQPSSPLIPRRPSLLASWASRVGTRSPTNTAGARCVASTTTTTTSSSSHLPRRCHLLLPAASSPLSLSLSASLAGPDLWRLQATSRPTEPCDPRYTPRVCRSRPCATAGSTFLSPGLSISSPGHPALISSLSRILGLKRRRTKPDEYCGSQVRRLFLFLSLPSSLLPSPSLLFSSPASDVKRRAREAGFTARLAPSFCDLTPGVSRGWVADLSLLRRRSLGPSRPTSTAVYTSLAVPPFSHCGARCVAHLLSPVSSSSHLL